MSTLKYNTWLNTDNTENYKCRAWVNFNGEGTVAIRSSGNVSSITDNGTGDYTVNFSNAMPDANYAVIGNARWVSAGFIDSGETVWQFVSSTTQARVLVGVPGTYGQTAASLYDNPAIQVAIFR